MSLTIVQDSREKIGKHKDVENYFKSHDITILRSKLPFGDYTLVNDMSIIIDFKQNMLEIEGNLTHDHVRFRNEILNANKCGIGLIILIEEEQQYKNLEDVKARYKIPRWKYSSPTHKKGQLVANFNVETIVKAMQTMQQKYGVLFIFVTKENCGQIIMKILVDYKDKYKCYFDKKLKEIKENGNN